MRFHVSILTQARRDIDRNADWWAEHHSVDQALRWSDAVYDQLESLADFPESNGLSAENDDFPFEIHRKAMDALRRQQDRDAIAQGITEMEAGEGIALDEAFDEIRGNLGLRQRRQ